MKNLYLGLISVIATISCKPVCVIEGNLNGMEGEGWIYMVDAWDDSVVIDSTRYQDGAFRFEVDAAEPTMVMLTCNELPDPRLHRFFNDAGTLSLTGSVEGSRKAQVGGTPLNDALNDVVRQMDEYYAESSMVKRQDRCMELFTEALNGNSGNALSLNLIEMSVQGMHPYVLLQYMEHLEPYLAEKAHAKQLKESLAKTYEQYKDKGLEVYTISLDNDTEAWKKFVTEKNFGWIDVIGGRSMPESKAYVVSGVPTSVLIDCRQA